MPSLWFTPISFIFEMNGAFYQTRKNGSSAKDRDIMFIKCHNGAACKWTGYLRMKDRSHNIASKEYYDPNQYTEVISDRAEDHTIGKIQLFSIDTTIWSEKCCKRFVL